MKKIVLLILIILGVVIFGFAQQIKPQDCQPSFAGSFYPGDPVSLKANLEGFFKTAKPAVADGKILRAIIVPHAGYVYSGGVAASGYNQIPSAKKYKRVFVLATSHRMRLEGAALFTRGDFITPLGKVAVDKETVSALLTQNPLFSDNPDAFRNDHVLEVQLPFLQYKWGSDLKIVPVMFGTQSASACKKIAATLNPYFTDENLFVVSSDFSHYPSQADAKKVDQETALSILSNSPEKFLKTLEKCESGNIPELVTCCCSWPGILTLLYMSAQQESMQLKLVEYKNSGDLPGGDRTRVVGYNAIALFHGSGEKGSSTEFRLNNDEKATLLALARETIEQFLKNHKMPDQESKMYPEALKTPCGAFVTLKKQGQLRGCIGNFSSIQPLFKVVSEMALAAAFQDYRFEQVAQGELKDIEVEISVLTPLKPIKSADEFKLGKQGIYMISGSRSGTFLPQVAEETNWTKEEFLGHCARDKAGIGWDGWKTAQLYTYEAIVFSESQFPKPSKK